MNFSEEERNQGMKALKNMAVSLIQDKNRIAKAAAAFMRNQLENFHVDYFSDKQMKLLNPLIRGAIYSFLIDFNDSYEKIASKHNIEKCYNYIYYLTIDLLRNEGISQIGIEQFYDIVIDHIGTPLLDLARGGNMLAGYELFYVPKYWEDCVYHNIKK